MGKRDKKLARLAPPDVTKSPRIAVPVDTGDERPAWRLSLLQMVDPFGWHKLDVASAERVRARLANFETMTWNEILVQGNKRFHRIATKNICKEAYEKLVELKQEDTDELVSLGLTQVERAWGIKEGSVLKVLWWDPEHMVYPTKPKNT